jgi:MFS family permease
MSAGETQVSDPVQRDRAGLRALWAANGVSMLGGQMTAVAVPWFILETTGSAARAGLMGTALALGGVLASLFSGPLIDRMGFKRGSVITDAAAAVFIAGIPLLYIAGVLQFWQILVLGFLATCMNAPGDSARYALVPGLAARAAMTIERANAVDRAVARATMLVGPLVGGVLIATLGAANVLLVDALTFVVSAILVAVFVRRSSQQPAADAAMPNERSYRAELVGGLRFVFANTMLLSIVLVAAVANGLDAALGSVVLPVYAREVWDSPTSLGGLISALGAGTLIGTVIFGAIGRRMPRRLTFLLGGAAGALLLYGGLALTPPFPVLLVLVALGGIVGGPILPLMQTVVQTDTPADMYGRVFGALQSMTAAFVPFATAIVGFVIEGAGLIPTIVGLGLVYVAITLGMLLNPALRRMDAAPPTVATS